MTKQQYLERAWTSAEDEYRQAESVRDHLKMRYEAARQDYEEAQARVSAAWEVLNALGNLVP